MANETINSIKIKENIYSLSLPYGVCSTAADTAAKVVTVNNFSLETGAMIIVKFTYANSASTPTLNVNNTGAKPIYRYGTTAASTGTTTTGWVAGAVQMFTYDGTGWVRDYWNNTTYSNAALGHGYVTCSTAEATTAKVGSLSSYSLTTGGIVSVKFTYAVPASATLNINSKGAKSIYYNGSAIKAGVIKAGDIATFIYSSQYHLISINRAGNNGTGITVDGFTINHSNSITAGNVGSAQSPSHGGTFAIPKITYDAQGHITSATTVNITLPADNNTSHSHSAGVGLTGSGNAGTSGGTYTYKAKIRSETALTVDSAAATTTSGRVYPVAVDKSGYLAVNVPWTHAVSSVNSKTGVVELSGYDVKAIPTFGQHNYNVDECYDAGLFMISQGSGCPSTNQYGVLLSLPYRKANGNETPDFGTQIYIPNGDDAGYPDSLFFRTSLNGSWNAWQEVAKKSDIPAPYSLPTASSSTLGGVKTTSSVTSTSGLTACPIISGVPYYKNTTYTFNGAISTVKDSNLTASRALISDASGKIAVSAVTSTELGYLDGVTSAIQTQLNAVPKSGDWWNNGICRVGTDGVTKVGKYIDFHNTDASTNAYDLRLYTDGANKNTILLPNHSGRIPALKTDAVMGSTTRPVYVSASGEIIACTGLVELLGASDAAFTLTAKQFGTSLPAAGTVGRLFFKKA